MSAGYFQMLDPDEQRAAVVRLQRQGYAISTISTVCGLAPRQIQQFLEEESNTLGRPAAAPRVPPTVCEDCE